MAVYVKNNFLLVPLVVLCLLVASSYGRFGIIKLSEGEIGTICPQSQNPSFCFNFFKSANETKTLDVPGVAKFLINYTSREVLDTQKQFESLVTSTTDPRSKNIYIQCSKNYKNVISEFDAALQALAVKDINSFYMKVSAAAIEGDLCDSELSSVKLSPQLLKNTSDIDNLSDIVVVISNIISN